VVGVAALMCLADLGHNRITPHLRGARSSERGAISIEPEPDTH
jgi:hypothetical protein